MTVLQHGVTPLEGVRPRVIVTPAEGGEPEVFPARETGRPGVYQATVVFASAGTWRFAVHDGFAAKHEFRPVQIGEGGKTGAGERPAVATTAAATPPSAGGDGPNLLLALGAAAVAAVAAGLGAALLQRRRGGPNPAAG
jgi:hypothetical protein